MKEYAVLVVGTTQDTELLELVFDMGLVPVFRQALQTGLTALQSKRFAAIIVDAGSPTMAALEFVLNVRELTRDTPVLIAGLRRASREEAVLQELPEVTIVQSSGRRRRAHAVKPALRSALALIEDEQFGGDS